MFVLYHVFFFFFFFFKQKTAYEITYGDWSSDVCSSDLKDKDLIIAVGNDIQWKSLCNALGLPNLARDRRFASNPSRVRNRHTLIKILSECIRRGTASH